MCIARRRPVRRIFAPPAASTVGGALARARPALAACCVDWLATGTPPDGWTPETEGRQPFPRDDPALWPIIARALIHTIAERGSFPLYDIVEAELVLGDDDEGTPLWQTLIPATNGGVAYQYRPETASIAEGVLYLLCYRADPDDPRAPRLASDPAALAAAVPDLDPGRRRALAGWIGWLAALSLAAAHDPWGPHAHVERVAADASGYLAALGPGLREIPTLVRYMNRTSGHDYLDLTMLAWGEQGWDAQVWSYARVSAFAFAWEEARPAYERAQSCLRALADPRAVYLVARPGADARRGRGIAAVGRAGRAVRQDARTIGETCSAFMAGWTLCPPQTWGGVAVDIMAPPGRDNVADALSRITTRRLRRSRLLPQMWLIGDAIWVAAQIYAAAQTASVDPAGALATIDRYRNTHRYGGSGGPGDYEFSIKARDAHPPDWVEAAIGVERAYASLGEIASWQLESTVEDLRARYPWLDAHWCTAGRSGGWLLLTDTESPIEAYEMATWYWERACAGAVSIADLLDAVSDYVVAVEALVARARDLEAIDRALREGVVFFTRFVGSHRCWAEIVPRPRLGRRQLGASPRWRPALARR